MSQASVIPSTEAASTNHYNTPFFEDVIRSQEELAQRRCHRNKHKERPWREMTKPVREDKRDLAKSVRNVKIKEIWRSPFAT
jgi:hypothetical protein